MKRLHAGISFTPYTAQTVLLELQDKSVQLRYLEQHSNFGKKDLWFLDAIVSLEDKKLRENIKVSIALDNSLLIIHKFPMDNTLTQIEQEDQIQWEISNFVANFNKEDYLYETHILKTNLNQQVIEVLVVVVPRSLVFNIKSFLSENNFDLEFIDFNYSSAEIVLKRTYPEGSGKNVALVEVAHERVDAGLLFMGRLASYRYFHIHSIEETIRNLNTWMLPFNVEQIFFHGSGLTIEWNEALRTSFKVDTTRLDPFKKIRISMPARNFSKYIGEEHAFTAAVGCALRTQ